MYATVPELKARFQIDDSLDDVRLEEALASATREIDAWCGRTFANTGSPTPRLYRPITGRLALVDDFSTTDGLVVETSTDGTAWTPWSAADYQLEPLGGVVEGMTGWPYWRVAAIGSRTLPTGPRATLRVTARWGWPEVPAPVKDACLIMAGESFKLADAPFGIAGYGEYGPVRVRMNSIAAQKLAPYRRTPVAVA